MLNEPVKKLNGFNLKLQEGFTAVRRIFNILDVKDEIDGGIDGEHEVSNVDQILDMNIVWTSRSFRSRHPNSTNKLVDIGNNCETLTKHKNCHHSF